MTSNLVRVAVAAAVLSLSAFAQTGAPAAAATTPAPVPATPKIGIINIQAAVANTNEGKRDLTALDGKLEPRVKELQALQGDVENLTKQLNTQGEKMNDDAKANLQKQITAKTTQFQRGREDYQNDVSAQEQEIFQRIYPKLMTTVDKYAKDNGFALVLDWGVLQQGVTWANPALDITQEIISAYNTSTPDIKAPAAPAGAPTAPSAAPKPTTPRPTTPRPAAPTTPKK